MDRKGDPRQSNLTLKGFRMAKMKREYALLLLKFHYPRQTVCRRRRCKMSRLSRFYSYNLVYWKFYRHLLMKIEFGSMH